MCHIIKICLHKWLASLDWIINLLMRWCHQAAGGGLLAKNDRFCLWQMRSWSSEACNCAMFVGRLQGNVVSDRLRNTVACSGNVAFNLQLSFIHTCWWCSFKFCGVPDLRPWNLILHRWSCVYEPIKILMHHATNVQALSSHGIYNPSCRSQISLYSCCACKTSSRRHHNQMPGLI